MNDYGGYAHTYISQGLIFGSMFFGQGSTVDDATQLTNVLGSMYLSVRFVALPCFSSVDFLTYTLHRWSLLVIPTCSPSCQLPLRSGMCFITSTLQACTAQGHMCCHRCGIDQMP